MRADAAGVACKAKPARRSKKQKVHKVLKLKAKGKAKHHRKLKAKAKGPRVKAVGKVGGVAGHRPRAKGKGCAK